MSLDKNLFTLSLTPNTSHPAGTVVDLTDGSGVIHYRKRRIVTEQQVYRIEVSGTNTVPSSVGVAHNFTTDPLSEALLASATAPSSTSKHKTLELYNPSNVVELKYTGTLTFRWSFKWETYVVLLYHYADTRSTFPFSSHQTRIRMETRRMLHHSEAGPTRACRSDKRTSWTDSDGLGSDFGLQPQSVRLVLSLVSYPWPRCLRPHAGAGGPCSCLST